MCKIKTICIIFIIIFLINSRAQTQDLQYDFNSPDVLTGVLPFDQPFSIKFINIDTINVNAIVVRIYETSISNYKKILKDLGYTKTAIKGINRIEITNADILKVTHSVIIRDSLINGIDFTTSRASMFSLTTLKPSTGYFIEIKSYTGTKLSESEQTILVEKLRNDPGVNNLIKSFADNIINNPGKFSIDSISGKLASDLIESSDVLIQKENKNYKLTIEPNDLKDILSKAFLYFKNIINDTTGLINEILNDSKIQTQPNAFPDTVRNAIKNILPRIQRIDWSNIQESDSSYNEFINYIDTLINKLKALPIEDVTKKDLDTVRSQLVNEFKNQVKNNLNVVTSVVAKIVAAAVIKTGTLSTTYPKEFVKQAGQFISSDLGLAYVWGIDKANPYVGAQISLRPINDSIPLRQYTSFGSFILSRSSILIGISVDGISKDSVRKGLIGDQALILGVGFKILPWFKINVGSYLYYKESANPIESRNLSFTGSPFISLSIDVRVQSLLNGIGNSIFKTQTP